MNANWLKNSLIYLLVVVAIAMLLFCILPSTSELPSGGISTVAREIKEGLVKSIIVQGSELIVERGGDQSTVISQLRSDSSLTSTLRDLGVPGEELAKVDIGVREESDLGSWVALASVLPPSIVFGGLMVFVMRQAQRGITYAQRRHPLVRRASAVAGQR